MNTSDPPGAHSGWPILTSALPVIGRPFATDPAAESNSATHNSHPFQGMFGWSHDNQQTMSPARFCRGEE